jgi:hypothetical protein
MWKKCVFGLINFCPVICFDVQRENTEIVGHDIRCRFLNSAIYLPNICMILPLHHPALLHEIKYDLCSIVMLTTISVGYVVQSANLIL